MDPVSISGREGRTVAGGRRNEEWNGYQLQIPLDEVFDCDSAPECCRTCYYKNRGMSKKKKCFISFLIFAVSIILTALIVRFSLGPIDIIIGIGDQRPVINEDTNFSPLLCSEYLMSNIPMPHNPVPRSSSNGMSSSSSTSFPNQLNNAPLFDAYMLLEKPYRSYQTASYETEEIMTFPTVDYFNYWAVHFESGSEVTMSLCPHFDVELRIVRGKSDLDAILQSHYVSHGYPEHTFKPCSSENNAEYRFAVSSPDDYAFVFTPATEPTQFPWMKANFTLVTFAFRRKELTFNTDALYASCKNVERCSLRVPNKAKTVMIEMRQNATTWPMTMRTECIPSIEMYFAFFMGAPAGFMILFASCGGVLYLCQKSVMDDIERAENLRRGPNPTTNRSTSSSPPTSVSAGTTSSGSLTRAIANRRAFRSTTSPRAPLVDHDVMSAMAQVNRHYDLPPTYSEVDRVSSPVDEQPPPSFDETQNVACDDPPSYDSIVT